MSEYSSENQTESFITDSETIKNSIDIDSNIADSITEVFEKEDNPDLVTLDKTIFFAGSLATVDVKLIILPQRFFFIDLRTSLLKVIALSKLELIAFCQSFKFTSSISLGGGPPELFINISTLLLNFFRIFFIKLD